MRRPGTPGACATRSRGRSPGRARRARSARAPRGARATPPPRASAAADPGRCRPPRAPPSTRSGIDRQLAGQDVVEHLAALAEARPGPAARARPPSSGVEPVVGVERLDDDDRRLDRRLRLERRRAARRTRSGRGRGTGRTPRGSSSVPGGAAIRSATSRWTMSTRRSGRGGSPEQRVQDRARDVVRQVGHDVVRRLDQVDEVLVERVALDESQRPSRLRRTARAGTPPDRGRARPR